MKIHGCNFTHPASVKEGYRSCLWNPYEIPVQERPSLLLICRSRESLAFKESRIQIPDNLSKDTALSGCSPAIHNNQHRKTFLLDHHLPCGQLSSRLIKPFTKFDIRRFFLFHPFLQHNTYLLFYQPLTTLKFLSSEMTGIFFTSISSI